tara:strand:+ start:924 stop:1166 length:243 start_codon:yes stop_codon:yes gene_type:complete
MEVRIGVQILRKDNRSKPEIDGEQSHVADPVHSLIEPMTECRKDIIQSGAQKITIGIQGNCVGVIVISGPINEGCALQAP